MTSKTLLVVPMKDPAEAKTRLAGSLSGAQRAALARLLFGRTLGLLEGLRTQGAFELAVVTGSTEIAAEAACVESVAVIDEGPCAGLSGAVGASAAWATARGFSRLCVVPADIVAPLAADLLRFLSSPAEVTICPAADQGTNALLVSPPEAMEFCYGPKSALRHYNAASDRGLDPVMMPLESLSFDVDTSECLAKALAVSPELGQALEAV